MTSTYEKGFRSVYSLTAHLLLVTKYRKKIISKQMLDRLGTIFDETCHKWNCKLVEFNGESDHVHLLFAYPPQVQLSKLIANLKTVSSRLIRKEYSEYLAKYYSKPTFWTGSYFLASCGGVTVEQLKKYVENQDPIR
ncbi:IS200/IS605 family transposase [Limnoraphis robusta Tam1]|uniref:IS200/IS605 family transposase n=1 Tax=Limnoraphis robusta CCNP1315 TaxID=3110306 RepID=A0ABU5TZ49_9CYAN|nr:IS200/IS605 family transposase [Limnoraphis robusta]MEA5520175.1 IS200/IS605 family transposase [Limnoraphis robusta CCNP1315]MEA5541760.1 IS200/IS605 family transposase [Limnoraphis robusta Tam1]MEA5543856.1 IS200/IS605 family transposase [Limnoraphis robusta CCNP1324]